MSEDKLVEIYEGLPSEADTEQPSGNYFIGSLMKTAIPIQDVLRTQNVYFLPQKPKPKRHKKTFRKKSIISRKEKQKLDLLKLPKTGWNYKEFEKLREMWMQYIISYLSLDHKRSPEAQEKLNEYYHVLLGKADYHGAEMTVVRSKCPSLVGITGTCIMDTKNTFRILSQDNKARTVPKRESVFKLHVRQFELTIYGKYFAINTAERGVRKIKQPMILDL